MSNNWAPENSSQPEIGHHGQAIRASITQALQHASEQDCNDSRNRLIPRTALSNVINIECVERMLHAVAGEGNEDANHLQSVAEDICPSPGTCSCGNVQCTGGRMIFATFLLCGKEHLLLSSFSLPNLGICDRDLPLNFDSLHHIDHGLTKKEKELLIHAQWQVYTPFLTSIRKDQAVGKFPVEVSLPWESKVRIGDHIPGEVSFVERIEIYSGNHDLPQNIEKCFALKTLEQRLAPDLSEERFQQEVEANLDAPKHDRVVRILAAFTYHDRFYLLFPFANEYSLERLWKSYTPKGVVQKFTRAAVANWYSDEWLISECLGITEALVATHGLDGPTDGTNGLLHADIKPENILCFRNSNPESPRIVLKLADFGEAQQVKPNEPLKANKVAHIMTYRPPEHSSDSHITLNYDIWCLGCLFLEFVTWAILGQEGIDSFSKEREEEEDDPAVNENPGQLIEDIFFKMVRKDPVPLLFPRFQRGRSKKMTVEHGRATTEYSLWVASQVKVASRLKDGVVSHLRLLQQHQRCSGQLQRVLSFVGRKMLVVDPIARTGSREVRGFLRNLLDHGCPGDAREE